MVGLTHVLAVAGAWHDSLARADSGPTLWYVTRTMGVAAYISMAFSVMLGIVRTIARRAREGVSWHVDELHQFVATLSVIMVMGHLLALRYDTYLPFSWTNLLLPVSEPYRPLAVMIGVFALYALAATILTSWFKRRLSYGVWRAVHYLSFVTIALVTLHGWLAGSDTGEPWMRAIYGGASACIVFLTLVRFFTRGAGGAASVVDRSPELAREPSAFGRRS
jgi:methionine sulfoxide reductase heme-binding subunit